MAKEKDNIMKWIIIVIGVIFLFSKGYIEMPNFSGGDTNVNVNVDGTSGTDGDDGASAVQQNLCEAFETNYPSYFAIREYQCGLAGGDYICKQDKAGCFDITAWDETTCTTTELQTLKLFCASQGGNWQCTATDVGCER